MVVRASGRGADEVRGRRVDRGRLLVGEVDRDSSGLRSLGDRKPQGEHAIGVAGIDAVGVEALAEEQLAAERALGAFADEQLDPVDRVATPLGVDGEDVPLDRELDRSRVDAREVELDDERLFVGSFRLRQEALRRTPGPRAGDPREDPHNHTCRSGPNAEDL